MKKFAVLQLSGCSGCEIALLNAKAWIDQYDLAYMNLVMSAHEDRLHLPDMLPIYRPNAILMPRQ